jgi:hypothetical protein
LAQIAVPGLEGRPFNLSIESRDDIQSVPEQAFLPDEKFQNHPEFGVLPYNSPCKDCFELIERRTETTRYFVKRGSEGAGFFEQTSFGALHVKDANGFWVSVDSRLKKSGNGIYRATNQLHPVVVSSLDGGLQMQNGQESLSWNKSLQLERHFTDGRIVNLGNGDYSRFTIGSDGMRFVDVWPGIDLIIHTLLSVVQTDLVFKTDPGEGTFVLLDVVKPSSGLRKSCPSGRFIGGIEFFNANGESIFKN